MFVDIRINVCTHKTRQTGNSFSLLPFQEDCLLFFALFYYSLLFLTFERGVAAPVTPHPLALDPPMDVYTYTHTCTLHACVVVIGTCTFNYVIYREI